MKTHSSTWAVVAILAVMSCASTPPQVSISAGVPFEEAAGSLQSASAQEVQMDILDQTTTTYSRTYELADGRVLIVAVDKTENVVSELHVCENADEPKSLRTWTSVERVQLGSRDSHGAMQP